MISQYDILNQREIKRFPTGLPVPIKSKAASKAPKPAAQRGWETWFFWMIMAAVLGLAAYIQVQWMKRPAANLAPPEAILPAWNDVVQNFKLMFQGYRNGYLRTLIGYGLFAMMACFFLAVGRALIGVIFKGIGGVEGLAGISFLERISLSYLLGTLAASLLWYGFGLAGVLNFQAALAVGVAGIILFAVQSFRGRAVQSIIEKGRAWRDSFTFTEKMLSLLLVGLLLVWSTTSVPFQTYSDTYQIHLPLPWIYIQDGVMKFNPYMIYSFFPQNTEMLVMWSLIFRSEVAAALLMWGFLLSLVALLWGFLKRQTNNLAALLSVFIVISAPVVAWFSMAIKNDMPTALFLLAHYITLMIAIDHHESARAGSGRWIFLSGVFCGGAIGHKLTALIPTVVSFIALLGTDLWLRRKGNSSKLSLYWLLGVSIAIAPWFLRTAIHTGNPIYPYFNQYFSDKLVKPWHTVEDLGKVSLGNTYPVIFNYLKHIMVSQNNVTSPPYWGPSFLLIVFVLFKFRFFSLSAIVCVISLLFAWSLNIYYSLEVRYHMVFAILFFSLSGIYAFKQILELKNRRLMLILIAIVICCFFQNLFISRTLSVMRSGITQALSGFSPGNYSLVFADEQANDMRWVSHLVNSRTKQSETVLFSGVTYGYGVDRKIWYGAYPDKEILHEIAEVSSDEKMLLKSLINIGIDNILFNPNFFTKYNAHHRKDLMVDDFLFRKITNLLENEMKLIYVTPSRKIFWFARNADIHHSLPLLGMDCMEYPILYAEAAESLISENEIYTSKIILENAINIPMARLNKVYIYALLGNIYNQIGEYALAEQTMLKSLNIANDRPEPYLYLALFYSSVGNKIKAAEFKAKGYELGGIGMINANSNLQDI